MAGEKKIEKHEPVVAGQKSDPSAKLAVHDPAPGKDGISSKSTSSISSLGDTTFSAKGETDQGSVLEQDVNHPPISCYNYYYPGYNGTLSQVDDLGYSNTGDGSYAVTQGDNSSLLYYVPAYNPCLSPSGYLQHPVAYRSEAMPCYSWDSAYARDVTNGTGAIPRKSKFAHNTNGSVKSNSFNHAKERSTLTSKVSTLPLDSQSRQSAATSNFSKPIVQTERLKPFKAGFGLQPAGFDKGFHPVGNFSSFTNQSQGFFGHNGLMNYRPNGRMWNGTNRINSREKSNRNGDLEASTELTRGPRVHSEVEKRAISGRQEQYNLENFQTDYEIAKFYVIKSYSEDDVHKCVKYDVWSSTPNGNKKLEAAFQDAEAKASETGTKCPVFLFFSVNGSGQFVGLAEMIGKVDFNKDMDFWQLDKWNGFFPVKWHIIKDVPNSRLRHIILENNDNRPVTFTRDAHEIGLKQGIEMLKIFKSYSEKTSVLDDFDFYENREKLLKAKRSQKPASAETDIYQNGDLPVKQVGESIIIEEKSTRTMSSLDSPTSLINLTNDLSLN